MDRRTLILGGGALAGYAVARPFLNAASGEGTPPNEVMFELRDYIQPADPNAPLLYLDAFQTIEGGRNARHGDKLPFVLVFPSQIDDSGEQAAHIEKLKQAYDYFDEDPHIQRYFGIAALYAETDEPITHEDLEYTQQYGHPVTALSGNGYDVRAQMEQFGSIYSWDKKLQQPANAYLFGPPDEETGVRRHIATLDLNNPDLTPPRIAGQMSHSMRRHGYVSIIPKLPFYPMF